MENVEWHKAGTGGEDKVLSRGLAEKLWIQSLAPHTRSHTLRVPDVLLPLAETDLPALGWLQPEKPLVKPADNRQPIDLHPLATFILAQPRVRCHPGCDSVSLCRKKRVEAILTSSDIVRTARINL